MFLRDNCDNCNASADVGIADERGVRLSLRIWQCVRCGHLTATAFDWERQEIVGAEVMNDEESDDERGRQRVRAAYRKAKERRASR